MSRLNIAFFVSGNGTLFEHIAKRAAAGDFDAHISLVISSTPSAKALDRAKALGIPSVVLTSDVLANEEKCTAAILHELQRFQVDFICLAGYLKMIPPKVVAKFRGRMINIHPALLPAFGGSGMYGKKVHEAVIRYGAKISGATVHLVDEEYDHGPIVLQRVVFVGRDDTVESLESKVHAIEYGLYFDALRLFSEDRVEIHDRRVNILPKST